MEIATLMTRDVQRVSPDTPIVDAARLMHVNNIGALPIEAQDRLIGMMTDRDIVTRVLGKGGRASTAFVRDAMTCKVFYVHEDQDAEAVARNMRDVQVRRLPVVDRDKRLVGIVSLGDLASRIRPEVAADTLEGIIEELGG